MGINDHKNVHFFQLKNHMNQVSEKSARLYNAGYITTTLWNYLKGRAKLFLGKHFCELDKKSQFIPPDEFKNYLTSDVYITQGFDHNLWVLSESSFQEIYKKLGSLNITDPLARMLFRLILGTATETGMDDQGYLKIPNSLHAYAHLDKKILLIGQGDYFEIWSPEQWSRQETELVNLEANTNRFSAYELTTR